MISLMVYNFAKKYTNVPNERYKNLKFPLKMKPLDDISIWLPLHYRFKISIENYASALSLFPLSNLLITLILDIIRVIRNYIDYFINGRKR